MIIKKIVFITTGYPQEVPAQKVVVYGKHHVFKKHG